MHGGSRAWNGRSQGPTPSAGKNNRFETADVRTRFPRTSSKGADQAKHQRCKHLSLPDRAKVMTFQSSNAIHRPGGLVGHRMAGLGVFASEIISGRSEKIQF
ncbi:unnamed protein product [Cuscuta epithymum]|uniref:Uncharacterized protein n=1 Tax=Cuscuta epithymum TaxID=186058 RepID=A0AAV0E033_9ASTE|nr:unnamed protein product [Cuscuta epithymum]